MMISLSFKLESPHFGYFLRGHAGLKLREEVENKYNVRIELPGDEDELAIDGESGNCESAKRTLIQAWYDDDFIKALEIIDLDETMPSREFFQVPVRLVSSLIGHYGRRIATLETKSQASIKIDCTGHVAVFGTEESCRRARNNVEDWVRRELGDRTWSIRPDAETDSKESTYWGSGEGPCLLTFLVPARAAALIIGRKGQNVAEFEKLYRCMVDLRTAEETREGMVPVDVTSKELRTAQEAKDGILRFLDRYFPNRDWPNAVEVRGVGNSNSNVGYPNSSSAPGTVLINKGGVQRITFSVAEEHAPRLIGTRGLNKKRLEERTNSVLILRTEERRNGLFPVDVIARSMEECENAQTRIIAFLEERPTGIRRHSWQPREHRTYTARTPDDDVDSANSNDSGGQTAETDRDKSDESVVTECLGPVHSSTPVAYSDHDPFQTDNTGSSTKDQLDAYFNSGLPENLLSCDLDLRPHQVDAPTSASPNLPIGTRTVENLFSGTKIEMPFAGIMSGELEMNSSFLERVALSAIEEDEDEPPTREAKKKEKNNLKL